MKTNRISFLVSLYVALFQISGKRPPRGSLAHLIEDHFDDYQFQYILNSFFQRTAKSDSVGVYVEGNNFTFKRNTVKGFGVGSKIIVINHEVDGCNIEDCDIGLDVENTSSDNLEEKNMPFEITENEFENVETVFKGPSNSDVKYVKNKHKNVVNVFDTYSTEVESILRQHGINKPIPSEILTEAKEIIEKLSQIDMTKDEIVPILEKKQLGQWLNDAALACTVTGVNVLNVIPALVNLCMSKG